MVRSVGARVGNATVQPDAGGVLRKFPLSFQGLSGFAVVAAGAVTAETGAPRSGDLGEQAWIDYRGPPETIRTVPYSRVLNGQVPAETFHDKIVVVGTGTPGLKDVHPIPTADDEVMSGAEVQANAIWTVANDFPLRSSAWAVGALLVLALAAIPPLLNVRLGPFVALLASAAVGCVYVVAVQLAFNGGTILPLTYPLIALAMAAIGSLAVTTVLTAFERQWVHDTFARFVPEPVVDEVLEHADEDHRLGGVRREGTVMFTDLRGFTSFSERLEPDRVVEVLNRYLAEMSEAIMDRGGTLVTYMGDGIMAVFGAPLEQPDHADRALACSDGDARDSPSGV